MKAVVWGILLLPIVSAISPLPASAQAVSRKFQCAQGRSFEAEVLKDKVYVKYDSGKTIKLRPLDSREGIKFANGLTLLTLNGNQAEIEINYITEFNQCVAQ